MEKELIKTNNYLLVVDDSEIKVNDWYYLPRTNSAYRCQADPTELEMEKRFGVAKVIAHLPINDSADLKGVPLLPPLEVEDGLEKLNEDLFDKGSDNVLHPQYQMRTFFNMGYNKAKEKYKFTEKDIAKAVMFGRWGETTKKAYQDFIQSLSQPKTPTHFEFEMESMTIDEIREQGKGFLHAPTFKMKTTNSQGQQVACGKYIY